MQRTEENKHLSKTVDENNGKILRTVSNLEESKNIISILKEQNLLGSIIVNTKVYSEEKNILEHQYIKGIIHSEEYTESMAIDSAEVALKLSEDLLKYNIYSWDLLPHNFTFHNGKWVLYDFGAISLSDSKVKTQIRGFFKIVFSSFELLKVLTRKDIRDCFLNRIKCTDLITMLPFRNWLLYFFRLNFCLLFLALNMHKEAYKYLYTILNKYKNKLKKNIFNQNVSGEEQYIYNYINNCISSNQICSVFCLGKNSAKWAVSSHLKEVEKYIYADDYDFTDEIYNCICSNNIKNITIGEIFPLINNDKIPPEYSFRAIYDNYAKERFNSDCTVFLDTINEKQNMGEFINNLTDFANKSLIIKTDTYNKDKILNYASNYYENTELYEIKNTVLINFKNRIKPTPNYNNEYKNGNRGYNAEEQTKKIRELLKSHNR